MIEKNKLFVKWKVENSDSKDLLFSIGGHPAFMCPIDGQGTQTDYNLVLKNAGKAVDSVNVGILAAGLLSDESFELKAENGLHKIETDLFLLFDLINETNSEITAFATSGCVIDDRYV